MLQKKLRPEKNLHYCSKLIALFKPDLKEQKDSERLILFRSGVNL